VDTLKSIRSSPTDQIIRGKQPVVLSSAASTKADTKKILTRAWSKPPVGWVKLTIDGSYKKENGSAGTGMVLRDDAGAVIFCACRSILSCEEALEAELLACLEGLELGFQHSDLPIIVETDCSFLKSAATSITQDRSPFMHLIADIKRLAKNYRVCKFVKVDRSQVRSSHCLANMARAEHKSMVWLGSSPDCVRQVLESELSVLPSD
jgi:ribonuclease HI